MDFLNQEIIFGLTLRHIGIGLLLLWILSGPIKKMLGVKGAGKELVKKKCRGCTWADEVSASVKRCPKCRGPLVNAE